VCVSLWFEYNLCCVSAQVVIQFNSIQFNSLLFICWVSSYKATYSTV
jgi:hypothetical protein